MKAFKELAGWLLVAVGLWLSLQAIGHFERIAQSLANPPGPCCPCPDIHCCCRGECPCGNGISCGKNCPCRDRPLPASKPPRHPSEYCYQLDPDCPDPIPGPVED